MVVTSYTETAQSNPLERLKDVIKDSSQDYLLMAMEHRLWGYMNDLVDVKSFAGEGLAPAQQTERAIKKRNELAKSLSLDNMKDDVTFLLRDENLPYINKALVGMRGGEQADLFELMIQEEELERYLVERGAELKLETDTSLHFNDTEGDFLHGVLNETLCSFNYGGRKMRISQQTDFLITPELAGDKLEIEAAAVATRLKEGVLLAEFSTLDQYHKAASLLLDAVSGDQDDVKHIATFYLLEAGSEE